ncbi:hypothetical protein CU669_16835 [Paramagnetospirillum kuznetsovii]|uniref:Uncharacterized protein n=1 Tax=Paramagnetospirillum kuznetsovii TaxID=2053833 RepID=A0A364NUI7_9PROT|nr:hypothetical protein [Paramagnetospirillum kuznetsovii]RAU20749.1 hypothetical protein CU669_16835 [Paramagnetospirillum kuznetsovii]
MPQEPNRAERMQALRDEMRRRGWRGLEIESGWVGILEEFCHAVAHIPCNEFAVAQIKEKFGTLRIYYTVSDRFKQFVADARTRAEARSFVTCIHCGCRGRMRNNGWHSVMCNVHDCAYKSYRPSAGSPSLSEIPGEDDPVSAYALAIRRDFRGQPMLEFVELLRGGEGNYLGTDRIVLSAMITAESLVIALDPEGVLEHLGGTEGLPFKIIQAREAFLDLAQLYGRSIDELDARLAHVADEEQRYIDHQAVLDTWHSRPREQKIAGELPKSNCKGQLDELAKTWRWLKGLPEDEVLK